MSFTDIFPDKCSFSFRDKKLRIALLTKDTDFGFQLRKKIDVEKVHYSYVLLFKHIKNLLTQLEIKSRQKI